MSAADAFAVETQFSGEFYGVGRPEILHLKAHDGAAMYVELWRPVKGPQGIDPPATYPVVLRMSAYESSINSMRVLDATSSTPSFSTRMRDLLVPQGIAFALGHTYGTGNSEGCIDLYGPNEIAATSSVVLSLARQPWSNGRVGMVGTSYDGGEALHMAAHGSSDARAHLAAIVVLDGIPSWYDFWGHDGVPGTGLALALGAGGIPQSYIGQPPAALTTIDHVQDDPPGRSGIPDLQRALERATGTCRAENVAAAAAFEVDASYSPWLAQRSARADADKITAATLIFEGFHDGVGMGALGGVGFFDRIPKSTPKHLILGQWGHGAGMSKMVEGKQIVADWFQRFLVQEPTDDVPRDIWIQDSSGAWRTERDWTSVDGDRGQLALHAGGVLGGSAPDSFTRLGPLSLGGPGPVQGQETSLRVARFQTARLPGPLHLAGLPVLDLWVELERGDARILTQLRAFDAHGTEITGAGTTTQGDNGRYQVVGARSARYLDPIVDGEFRQRTGVDAPVNVPVRIPVRFTLPVDLVIPANGTLVVEIASTNFNGIGPWTPSTPGGVKILHDCDHPSALRFLIPKIREQDKLVIPMARQRELAPVEVGDGPRNAGGLATAPVCGKQALDPERLLERPGGTH